MDMQNKITPFANVRNKNVSQMRKDRTEIVKEREKSKTKIEVSLKI